MTSNAASSVASHRPRVSRGSGDESFWQDYFERVIAEDSRIIHDWQSSLNALLVYDGLFIAVLTAFIIQMSSLLHPSTGDATNRILIAIYMQMTNATTSTDLGQYLKGNEEFSKIVPSSIFLLYTSLALSIAVAAFALMISVWLIRYRQTLTETGLTIHERIRKRHEAYRRIVEWKLPTLIEMQPLVVLLALLLFSTFICQSVYAVHPSTSVVIFTIFAMASIFFLWTIPIPSPLHFVFASRMFPNWSIRIPVTLLLSGVVWTFLIVIIINRRLTRFETTLLGYLLFPSGLVAFLQLKKTGQKPPKPRLLSLPTLVYSCSSVIPAVVMMLIYARTPFLVINFISYYLTGAALLILMVGRAMPHLAVEGQAKAEALGWMIKRGSHDLITFQQAVELARNSHHFRFALLKDIFPVLDILITSIQRGGEGDLSEEEKTYITLLAILVDFEPCKAVFWRNRAAMEHPILSEELKGKLRILRHGGSCTHGDGVSPGSGCPKVDATFILSKTGEMDGQNMV